MVTKKGWKWYLVRECWMKIKIFVLFITSAQHILSLLVIFCLILAATTFAAAGYGQSILIAISTVLGEVRDREKEMPYQTKSR